MTVISKDNVLPHCEDMYTRKTWRETMQTGKHSARNPLIQTKQPEVYDVSTLSGRVGNVCIGVAVTVRRLYPESCFFSISLSVYSIVTLAPTRKEFNNVQLTDEHGSVFFANTMRTIRMSI